MHFFKSSGTVTTLALILVGCGSSAHPNAADDDDTAAPKAVNVGTSTSAVPPSEPCTAGATRACSMIWYDIREQKHCIPSIQFCKKDGSGWLACGSRAETQAETQGEDKSLQQPSTGEGDGGADSSF